MSLGMNTVVVGGACFALATLFCWAGAAQETTLPAEQKPPGIGITVILPASILQTERKPYSPVPTPERPKRTEAENKELLADMVLFHKEYWETLGDAKERRDDLFAKTMGNKPLLEKLLSLAKELSAQCQTKGSADPKTGALSCEKLPLLTFLPDHNPGYVTDKKYGERTVAQQLMIIESPISSASAKDKAKQDLLGLFAQLAAKNVGENALTQPYSNLRFSPASPEIK